MTRLQLDIVVSGDWAAGAGLLQATARRLATAAALSRFTQTEKPPNPAAF
jgi:hypothetical protein